MQEIRDQKKLEEYLKKFAVWDLFDTRDLPFRLYRYEVGEMMNILRTTTESMKLS